MEKENIETMSVPKEDKVKITLIFEVEDEVVKEIEIDKFFGAYVPAESAEYNKNSDGFQSKFIASGRFDLRSLFFLNRAIIEGADDYIETIIGGAVDDLKEEQLNEVLEAFKSGNIQTVAEVLTKIKGGNKNE